jgi:hypothetical protein
MEARMFFARITVTVWMMRQKNPGSFGIALSV